MLIRLQYGANPRYCDSEESNTALHFAAMFGNGDFIKILVEYGADINAVFQIPYIGKWQQGDSTWGSNEQQEVKSERVDKVTWWKNIRWVVTKCRVVKSITNELIV